MARPLLSAELLGNVDVSKLIRAMDAKERRVLFKTGNDGRKFMKEGMRKTGKRGPASSPGGFPASRLGPLKKTIAFAVDPRAGTVVIGPRGFDAQPRWLPTGIRTVPQLLNEGGIVRRHFRNRDHPIYMLYRPRPFVDLTNVPTSKKFAENMKNIPLGV